MTGHLDELGIMMVEEGFTPRDLLESLLLEVSQTGNREAFFVADLEDVVKKHLRFLKALPRIKPFYTLKCNGSKGVVQLLAGLGAGFGCVNKTEIALVKSLGVPSDRIICSSSCKQISLIRYAASQGVQLMTFDNEVELGKVARNYSSARMILCLATDDSKSSARLSIKFGATLKSCRHLLETAKNMNVEVVGISFHIGSSCTDPQIFTQSIADARLVFEMGAEIGYKMCLLDFGGGFPGAEESKGRFEEVQRGCQGPRLVGSSPQTQKKAQYIHQLRGGTPGVFWEGCVHQIGIILVLDSSQPLQRTKTAAVINSALDLYFPEGCGVEIVAELGRYYVSSAFTLAVNIVAKKEVPLDQPGSNDKDPCGKKGFVYHINDGVYGSFGSVVFSSICPVPSLQKKPPPDPRLYSSSLWGPTGDGLDRIADSMELPELYVGDWLIFENMGAHTAPASSTFSGAQHAQIHYAMSQVAWEAVQLLQGKILHPEEEDRESTCTPLSCGWEITDTLCVAPVFTPASIM